mmetsp:Transcript_81010/g.194343  ORF Transcript_81010/g.194343 Transcript_81010/m.194343 type:complete len:245 (-) Transcript_81010:471-1205(-)
MLLQRLLLLLDIPTQRGHLLLLSLQAPEMLVDLLALGLQPLLMALGCLFLQHSIFLCTLGQEFVPRSLQLGFGHLLLKPIRAVFLLLSSLLAGEMLGLKLLDLERKLGEVQLEIPDSPLGFVDLLLMTRAGLEQLDQSLLCLELSIFMPALQLRDLFLQGFSLLGAETASILLQLGSEGVFFLMQLFCTTMDSLRFALTFRLCCVLLLSALHQLRQFLQGIILLLGGLCAVLGLEEALTSLLLL